MRSLPTLAAGMVSLALVGAASGAVILLLAGSMAGCTLLEDECEDPYRPAAFVTGQVTDGSDWEFIDDFAGEYWLADWRGTFAWEASDPRLSGDVTVTELAKDQQWFGDLCPDRRAAQVQTSTWEVVNAGGRWSGTASEIVVEQPSFETATVVLSGEGAYAGLTAYLITDNHDEPGFRGLIFPGPMPPFPDLPSG